jgi:hypothetical protein
MNNFDKNLKANESTLCGMPLLIDGKVVSDITWARIDWLAQHHLQKIASSTSGWETLYRDPNDGRLWERTYPQSEAHGGGPPRLSTFAADAAEKKYAPR